MRSRMATFEQVVLQAEQQLTQADLYHGHGMSNAYDEGVCGAVLRRFAG